MAVYDVFLSYRRSDGSDLAKDLYQKLQRAGLRVFFDQSEMVDGHYFNTQISAALKQAPNYLLVATPEVFPFRDEAQESDWVKKEIELAFEQYEQDQQNRSLNILMLPGTELPAESSLPESLKNLDLPNQIKISWSLQSSELQRILKAVCHVNRRNIWHAAHRWLEESKQPGHRFASLHVNESIMPQAKHHKEDRQNQTTFPIHVSKEATDMQKQEIPLLDALRETSGHLYLIGQGGIGKTTALIHIMEAAYHEKQYTETAQIPIFIELSRAPDTEGRLYDGITSTYIRRSVYQQIREDLYVKQVSHSAVREVEEVFDVEPSVAVKPVEELFLAKQDGQSPEYLLLLDGLNEVSHTEVNELPVISRIIREIQWLMDCPNVRVILTSRTDEEAVFHENISRLYLTGIQNEALRDYLQKSKHEEEIDAIFQNEPLLETLRIPLFLMMYAGLGQTKDVSSQGEILRIFFHEREQNLEDYTIQTRAKQVEQDVATASPKQSSVRITAQMQSFLLDFLLPEIAWAMERNDTFYLDTETIEEIIAPILTDKSDTAICGKYGKGLFTKYRTSSAKEHTATTAKKLLTLGDDTLEVTESLIDIATRSLGILQERNGTYGFIHHHIRDYFAAARHVVHLRLAVYLQEKGSEQALTCLDDLKPEPIHLNIRRFIGEMLGEHHNAPQCINGTWTEMVPKEDCDRTLLQRALFLYRNRFDEKNDYSVFTVVSILKEVRQDLSGVNFSNLDLTTCSLNGVRLGRSGIAANIKDSIVDVSTFFHTGHTDAIHTISYSPDAHYLLTGSPDGTIKIWDISTGTCLQTLKLNYFDEFTCIYSPNGRYITIGFWNKSIEIWDLKTSVCIKKLPNHFGHKFKINSIAYSSDGRYILSGDNNGMARIWSTRTGKQLYFLKNHSPIVFVDFSANGNAILGFKDGMIKLWSFSVNDYKVLNPFKGALSAYSQNMRRFSVSFLCSPDHQYIVLLISAHYYFRPSYLRSPYQKSIVRSNSIVIFNIKEDSTTSFPVQHNHDEEISCFDISSDNKSIATASLDGTIKIWDIMTGLSIQTLKRHSIKINSIKYSIDGEHIVAGYSDGCVKIWNTKSGVCSQTLSGYAVSETSCDFSPDGRYVIIGSSDGTVKEWNLSSGICNQTIANNTSRVLSAVYTPNGTDIVTVSEDGFCKIWDIKTGIYKYSIEGSHKSFAGYSPNFLYIATHSIEGFDIIISNLQTGVHFTTLNNVLSFAYSPNKIHLATSSVGDNSIKIWSINLHLNTCINIANFFIRDYCSFEYITYSPDGNHIALIAQNFNTKEESIIILNITTKEYKQINCTIQKIFSTRRYAPTFITYTPDGSQIIASYNNNTIKIWDVNTGKCKQNIKGAFFIWDTYICCSPDGSKFGSISYDGSLELWDIASGQWIDTLPYAPGLMIQGVDFRHIHPNSSLDEKHRELLRRYGAIID